MANKINKKPLIILLNQEFNVTKGHAISSKFDSKLHTSGD